MDPPKEPPWNGKRARSEPTPATSGDGYQSARLQPSPEHEGHLQRIVRTANGSARQDILADLVQNTAEYSGRVADLLSFRGVSTKWQSAVCDALGYLNGRCWTRFALGEHDGALWASLRVDDPIVVARCAVLCLRPRLETVEWIDNNTSFHLPLQLLGENNTTLTTLNLDAEKLLDSAQLRELRGLKQMRLRVPDPVVPIVPIVGALAALEVLDLTSHPVTDLKGLQGLVALRALTLGSTPVTNEHFAGLENVLAGLHTLDLSWCEKLTMISNIAACVSLRQLNLAYSGVEDLQGLERLVALETLDISCVPARDWCILRQCPQLAHLTAGAYDYVLSTSEVQAMVDNAAHCLVKWVAERTSEEEEARALTDVRPASFLRCTVLRELDLTDSDVDNAAIHDLAEIPALERLTLYDNPVSDVRALAGCRALRELFLGCTPVTNAGIVGLEQIVTLEKLDLVACTNLTAVTRLRHCAALRELNLGSASVTCAGIEGLECIATLMTLSLDDCKFITRVSTLQHSPSLRSLDISNTHVTAAGIAGLEKIVTLERLDASGCERLDNVITLRRCPALRYLDLSDTSVGNASMVSLACVATLESLWLAQCARLTDVSELCGSVSLRDLDLMLTAVDDDGIVSLERIPTLTLLDLTACVPVTNVRHLIRSKSLRRLILSSSGVTDAGIVGIETAPALEFLELQSCPRIADVAAVERRAAEHAVKLKT
jgi:Leucine-rich repeat (LRR) protein